MTAESMLTLTESEVQTLTGYRQPARQLAELHRLGFWRARIAGGVVVVERAHYEAVCAGVESRRPKVRPPYAKAA